MMASAHALHEQHAPTCRRVYEKRHSFLSAFSNVCLSRACLGKMMAFLYINGAKSGVFRTDSVDHPVLCEPVPTTSSPLFECCCCFACRVCPKPVWVKRWWRVHLYICKTAPKKGAFCFHLCTTSSRSSSRSSKPSSLALRDESPAENGPFSFLSAFPMFVPSLSW
jgi:hypothetical protein